MADYKNMYLKLFRETTKAIELLQNAQIECEDIYINSPDADIHEIDFNGSTSSEPSEEDT